MMTAQIGGILPKTPQLLRPAIGLLRSCVLYAASYSEIALREFRGWGAFCPRGKQWLKQYVMPVSEHR